MNKKYQSEAMQVIHDDMKGMQQLGIISDDRMSEFDEMCLIKEPEISSAAKKYPKTEYVAAEYRRGN